MAQKGKNENLKDRADERPRRKKKPSPSNSLADGIPCPNSIGVMSYLLEPTAGQRYHRMMDSSRMAKLRRAFKQYYGYKPVGVSEQQLERTLADRSIAVHGDPHYIFDHMW